MVDLGLLTVFTLAVAAMGAALGLSGAFMARLRRKRDLKTFLFMLYLTLLFCASGLRFAFGVLHVPSDGIRLMLDVMARVAYASLVYFLPATVNHILQRRWTSGRLIRVISVAAVYLVASCTSLFLVNLALLGLFAGFSFLALVLFVLLDALRSVPMVAEDKLRGGLFFIYAVTFLFLPLAQIMPLVAPGHERLVFFVGALYFIFLGGTATFYYAWRFVHDSQSESETKGAYFRQSCTQAGLSPRESEVAECLSQGATYKEIAAQLNLSTNTVSNHIASAYRKTGTRSKLELVNFLRKEH